MRAMVAKNAHFFKQKYCRMASKNLIYKRNLYFSGLKKALRRKTEALFFVTVLRALPANRFSPAEEAKNGQPIA